MVKKYPILKEYTKRYGKTHLSITKCKEPLKYLPLGIPDTDFTQPPQCMPDELFSMILEGSE